MTTGVYIRKDEAQRTINVLRERIGKLAALAHDAEMARRYCEGYEAALADTLALLDIDGDSVSMSVTFLTGEVRQ